MGRRYFYPRSPCGERLQRQIEFERYSDISIHALLAESDIPKKSFGPVGAISIHALLAESDAQKCYHSSPAAGISIHALLAESDVWSTQARAPNGDFYPRSPCGERPITDIDFRIIAKISIHALLAESDPNTDIIILDEYQFLSTLSLRRATTARQQAITAEQFLATLSLRRATCSAGTTATSGETFLSTLSLRRATPCSSRLRLTVSYFYPRSPCGERPPPFPKFPSVGDFYPRSPCGERPVWQRRYRHPHFHFYPRSPCGERQNGQAATEQLPAFLSTLSLRRATRCIL